MKRLTTILLLSIYLCASTEMYQLLKLPAFAMHYIQHSQEDPELTLIDFIRMHYAEAQVFDADWAQDMQLPFKSCESAAGLAFALHLPVLWDGLPQPLVHTHVSGVLIQKPADFVPGLFEVDIFQPPRSSSTV